MTPTSEQAGVEPANEPYCDLDPITWDAMVDAMKAHGVPDATVGDICHDALYTINTTPEAVRTERNAEAGVNVRR